MGLFSPVPKLRSIIRGGCCWLVEPLGPWNSQSLKLSVACPPGCTGVGSYEYRAGSVFVD